MKERHEPRLAIATPASSSGIDRLIDAAARRPIAPARDPEVILREALIVGRARARTASRRRVLAITSTGTLALAAMIVLAMLPGLGEREPVASTPTLVAPVEVEPAPPPPAPMVSGPVVLALPDAHRAFATPASDLAIESSGDNHTVLRLAAGAALFDVAPLGVRGSFEVRTPDATVSVRGTVFAVTVESSRTRVEVFEGRVEVRDARGAHVLGAGESYATDVALRTPDELVTRGERAARARAEVIASTRPAVPRAVTTAPVDLSALRAMCDRGDFAGALAAIDTTTPPRAERGEWALVEGDAHRALGHAEEAADAYARAAAELTPTRAALAGFLAATQRERAGDLASALDVLERTHAAERGSPLEERAVAMRASLLARLGRREEARIAARAYLASYPAGEAIARMEALLAE